MQHFPAFASDLQLMERLVAEESVFCLPGQCFEYPDFMRLVLTVPADLMREACNRIACFVKRHYVPLASPIMPSSTADAVDVGDTHAHTIVVPLSASA